MRTERLSACQPSTCSERAGAVPAEAPAVDRSATSVIVNSPGATYIRCFPLPRVTEESWEHSRTLTGRPPDSCTEGTADRGREVAPVELMTGPLPQARLNLAVLDRACRRAARPAPGSSAWPARAPAVPTTFPAARPWPSRESSDLDLVGGQRLRQHGYAAQADRGLPGAGGAGDLDFGRRGREAVGGLHHDLGDPPGSGASSR